MGMIDRIAAIAGFERREQDTSPLDPSWRALAPMTGHFAAASTRAAENLSAVLACSTVIATSLASIPALVYRRDGGSRLEAIGHPLYRIARQGVSPGMTWPDFIEHLVASALLTGNGLAEIVRGANGALTGFRFLPWGNVSVVELSSGRLAYDVSNGRGKARRLLQDEVLHLRDRTNGSGVGVSRLARAAEAMQTVQASNTFARKFLENGAHPSGFIRSATNLTDKQISQLRDNMAERHSGAANAGRVGILSAGLEWVQAQISPEDAELLESRKFGVEEVCRLFQVPPPLVQDYSHNTFTNSETAGRWFAMFTLAPWARKIEAEFARSVFPSSGAYEMELDLSGFLRGDPATRWNAHKIAIETGVLDAEEVRQVEGWNPRKAKEQVL
ncbi:phage portal protein [Porphyrobacter algicida]|uniref:Phage portal protein n=2 Tax=Qipengyuania algicida TaxID=1836209 RepID=A0A845AFV7_9SPHN|nr:phage portal protein [Qipengyuania algicida]